uniref:O1_Vc6.3iii prepropeptide n=1 Tax=Conus victoriae TaxID=319920 RepID=W4VS54_CONVC
MKLTCMMIVAVLFLTAWTFATADDPGNGLRDLFSIAHHEMKNPEASKLNEKCYGFGEACLVLYTDCCGYCVLAVCL